MEKDLKNFEGFYTIDEYGNIYSIKSKKYLKPKIDKDGYLTIHLCKNGKNYYKSIHRLLAETFIENNNYNNSIDHIDNDKTNNNLDNLRWLSLSDNVAKANRNRDYSSWYKKIKAIDENGNIKIFNSIKEASEELNIPQSYISCVLTKRQKTAKKYKFEYF